MKHISGGVKCATLISIERKQRQAQTIHRHDVSGPVFPAVPSTMMPGFPGTSSPFSSASIIIHTAARS